MDRALTLDIVDASVGGNRYASVDAVADANYRAFINGVTNALAATGFSADWRFGGAAGRDSGSTLVFRRSPLVTSGDAPFPSPPAPPVARAETCRVATPWFTFNVVQGTATHINGVFHWNERQVLRDRAVLAGVAVSLDSAPKTISRGEFERLARLYAKREIPGGRSAGSGPPHEAIPPEMLWLFRQAPQTTFVPFAEAAIAEMPKLGGSVASYYGRLAGALVRRCTAGGADLAIADIRVALRTIPSIRP